MVSRETIADAGLRAETRAIDGAWPCKALVVEPVRRIVVDRERLQRLRRGDLSSAIDDAIIETVTRAEVPIDVVLFRACSDHPSCCWRFADDLDPSDLDELRVLIVLGGPMGVADVGKPEYPWLAQEVELLKKCVARDRAVLGICLGAQLLAHAAGAKVYPNVKMVPGEKHGDPPKPAEPLTPLPQIGWAPVLFPFPILILFVISKILTVAFSHPGVFIPIEK